MFDLKSRIQNLRSRVSIRELYDRWAPLYPPVAHNPVMRAEQAAMLRLLPDMRGCRVLDLACGSGRYAALLAERGARLVVGLDFSDSMLARLHNAQRVCGSMMSLPLAAGSFDIVVSGLAVGHADDLTRWVAEAARMLMPRGLLLYSDFHPFAVQAGWRRSFRAEDGHTYHLPFRVYALADHRAVAQAAGLSVIAIEELRIGVDLSEPFDGSPEFYRRWHDKPIVLVVALRKP